MLLPSLMCITLSPALVLHLCPPPVLPLPTGLTDLQGKRWRPRLVLFQLFHPQDVGRGTFGAKEWAQPPCLEHRTPLRGRELPGGGSLCGAATQMA